MYSTGSSVRRMPVSRAAAISARDIAAGIGVRPAVGRVVQVVEFADRGVAGFQHLDVQLRGDRLQRFGVEARGEAVHGFAPGPERVLGIGLALGQAGHRALERMRMQVGDAGHDPARAGGGLGGCDRGDAAVVVDVEPGVGLPAAGVHSIAASRVFMAGIRRPAVACAMADALAADGTRRSARQRG